LNIDATLQQCGWVVQDHRAFNPGAGQGIALREIPLDSGRCDYLLLVDRVDRKPVGVIEAKKEGTTLSSVANQSRFYGEHLPRFLRTSGALSFFYESTGVEIYFRDQRDPDPRSRRVFAFHCPDTPANWIAEADTLRHRLRRMSFAHPLSGVGMSDCQVVAFTQLGQSFVQDSPRALIQTQFRIVVQTPLHVRGVSRYCRGRFAYNPSE
jgi:type I restriction enzyme, R subunit